MKTLLQKLVERGDLTRGEITLAFDSIMDGRMTQSQMGGFLVALRMKGETVEELAGAASSLRRHSVLIDTGGLPVVDTCGTGGDGLNTFNISTAAAFVVAGAGVRVAKHGNRAMSSRCGSADVLAALGVNLEAPPERVEECIRGIGIGFLFAQKLHPAMKHAALPRRELGVRTIFNMLGPLANPAGARGQLLGVFAPELTEPFAMVLRELGSRRALVVHGMDGMDEITVAATTRITELRDGRVETREFDPLPFIGEMHAASELAGGAPETNAAILRDVLSCRRKGACRDIVLLNAAAGIVAGGKADDFGDALLLARESLDGGRAMEKLEALARESQ